MITALLIIHGLMAVALLGALTHQTLSVWWPAAKRNGSFFKDIRAVSGAYTPMRRSGIRVVLQDYHLRVPEGSFELKEHFVTIGLGLLPAYWYYWRLPLAPDTARGRHLLPFSPSSCGGPFWSATR